MKKRILILIIMLILLIGIVGGITMFLRKEKTNKYNPIIQNNPKEPIGYDSVYPYHEPFGNGVGVKKGRVVWNYNPKSVNWDGEGYWWELDHFDENIVLKMINDSIASLGDKATAKEGWEELFKYFNNNHDKGNTSYKENGIELVKIYNKEEEK